MIAVLAMAQLLVIVTRGIDLSVGSTLALSAVVGAMVFDSAPSGPLVILAMLATGTAVGAVNGMAFVWGRLPHAFIITLATLSIARGLALWLSGGQPVRGMPEVVQTLGGGSIGWLPYSAFLVVRSRAGRDRTHHEACVGPLDLRRRRKSGWRDVGPRSR